MNLLQKFPVSLGFACLLMLSSCSEETINATSPLNESKNSSLREGQQGGGIEVLPSFPTTNGPTGNNVYATRWQRDILTSPDNPQLLPTGSSSFTNLWGDSNFSWIKPLPAIPGVASSASIATVTTTSNTWSPNGKRSAVKTKLQYLKPGKKYAITFRVATTKFDGHLLPFVPAYSKTVYLVRSYSTGAVAEYIDLTGKQAAWVDKTITFVAEEAEMTLSFSAINANAGEYSYAHIFVDKNAIQEVN
ncbi:hypothetical protein [Dyadobacter sp. Leaf189]|uniref:hypothetical protein n=1 Tax=Dyadobacter sp. Leaf189 TaxID=1736295 RepID=UPI0012FABC8F|nr:hypothetical protein [Dyadobacter sp. Leaf189]